MTRREAEIARCARGLRDAVAAERAGAGTASHARWWQHVHVSRLNDLLHAPPACSSRFVSG